MQGMNVEVRRVGGREEGESVSTSTVPSLPDGRDQQRASEGDSRPGSLNMRKSRRRDQPSWLTQANPAVGRLPRQMAARGPLRFGDFLFARLSYEAILLRDSECLAHAGTAFCIGHSKLPSTSGQYRNCREKVSE